MSNGIYFFLSECIKYIPLPLLRLRTKKFFSVFLLMMCRWRHEDGTSLELSLEKIKYSVYAELKSLLEDRAHNFHGCIKVSWPCCKKCKIMAKIGQEKQDRGGNCTNQSMAGLEWLYLQHMERGNVAWSIKHHCYIASGVVMSDHLKGCYRLNHHWFCNCIKFRKTRKDAFRHWK